jgi:flagellar biosynthesis protein FliQ
MQDNIADTLGVSAWADSLREAATTLSTGAAEFVPKLIIAFIIIVFGWIVGAILGRFVAQIIRSMRVDNVLKSAGAEDTLARAGFGLNSGRFVGGLVKWFIIVVFLVAAFDVLGLSEVNDFLRSVLDFLPRVIVAVLILLAGTVIAEWMQKIIVGGARAAEFASAPFLGVIAKWIILVFAILIAMDQIAILQGFSQILFTGVVAMLTIAGGLAFGLGGRDAAKRYIEKIERDYTGHTKHKDKHQKRREEKEEAHHNN